jgi:hypothetical protein
LESGVTNPVLPSLAERLQIAGQMVVRAQIFFDCWWYYESTETRPAILGTMNDYSEFFRFDSHAQFVSMVMYLGSLYDKRRDTITLPRLAKETASAIPARAAELPVDALSKAEALAEKLSELRHNLFAHRSASVSYAEAFRRANITAFEIRELLALSFDVVNRLMAMHSLPEVVDHALSRSDLVQLLRRLGATIP